LIALPLLRLNGEEPRVAQELRVARGVSSAIGRQFSGCGHSTDEGRMLYWALVFFIIAIVAGVLGFGGIASAASGIAQILFFVFVVIFLIALIAGLMGRRSVGPPL
jgi:uncharacterized membrane protein YtjA (UPF0391 family)